MNATVSIFFGKNLSSLLSDDIVEKKITDAITETSLLGVKPGEITIKRFDNILLNRTVSIEIIFGGAPKGNAVLRERLLKEFSEQELKNDDITFSIKEIKIN